MKLTYDKTNKTLSLIAVTVFLTVNLISIFFNLSNVGSYILSGSDGLLRTGIFNLTGLLSYLFQIGIVVALILRKKNGLAAVCFALPWVYSLFISPIRTHFILPLLLKESIDVVNVVLEMTQATLFLIPSFLFYLAIIISCFTKGKLFGEKAGIVILVLGVLAYLNAVTQPVTQYFVSSVVDAIRFSRELYIGEFFEGLFRYGHINCTVLLTASPLLLIALAFFLPNKELLPEEAENTINEEENAV